MDRRSFLGSILALGVAPAIVHASSIMRVVMPMPILWGDGIHDDTAALQALLDRVGSIDGGIFRISDQLIIHRNETLVTNSHFDCADMPSGKSAFYAPEAQRVMLNGCRFDSR